MLDIPAGKGISSGESARRFLGRTLFPHARPGWARAVVCAPALAVFQQPDELIGGEEKLAKVFVQHALAHVLPGMGFPEGNNLWVTARVTERPCRTRFPLLRRIAELPENAEETPPWDLRWKGRHRSESRPPFKAKQVHQCLASVFKARAARKRRARDIWRLGWRCITRAS
jgi:hypothetical protein